MTIGAPIKHHELFKELETIVGPKYVSDLRAVLLTYTRALDSFPAAKPQGIVVRPNSVEEVVEIVKLANQTRTPLVPMGGKNAYSGAPDGEPGRGIVVDMRRMNRIIEIDEVNMTVTCQAGIHLGELLSRVNERGWAVHTAWMPHYGDTVGGQLSGYAGGGWGPYGPSVGFNGPHFLLGMKVVLPDGSVVDTGSGEGSISSYRGRTFSKLMHGPDPSGLFCCDSGMFGIKVEATYKMFHPPKFQAAGVRYWDNPDEPMKVLDELWHIDPYLYMQPYCRLHIITPEFPAVGSSGFELTMGGAEPWCLYWLSLGMTEEEVNLKTNTVDTVCAKHGGKPHPKDKADELKWLTEKWTSESWEVGKFGSLGQMPFFELVVSKRDLLDAIKFTKELVDNLIEKMKENGIDTSTVIPSTVYMPAGPEGIGITCVAIFFDQNDKEAHKMVHEGFLEFLEQAHRRGYQFDGTHNNGSKYKQRFWTPSYNTFITTMKKTLDPNNIMNPGVYNF